MEKSDRPYVIISAAVTIDGRIATRTGDSRISSRMDLERLHRLRASSDAILVGRNTMLCDDPLLTVRHVTGKNPTRVVLDPLGEMPSDSQILNTCNNIPTILVLTGRADIKNQKRLANFNIEIVRSKTNRINPRWLALKLFERNIKTLLVEGGGATNWTFIKENVFDEIILTISPYIAGNGTSVIHGEGFAQIQNSPSLHLKSIHPQGDEIVVRYTRN